MRRDWLLLDTDVISYLFRDDSRTDLFQSRLVGKTLAYSFMTEAELLRWGLLRDWGPRRTAQLEALLQGLVRLDYDQEVGRAWARITATCSRHGRSIAPSDAWIAATAVRAEIPLLTHNLKHFEVAAELCGLELFCLS